METIVVIEMETVEAFVTVAVTVMVLVEASTKVETTVLFRPFAPEG